MPRIGDHKQLLSGFIFALLGSGALAYLPGDVGTAAAMGPGYFPMLLAGCLICLGAASMLSGVLSRNRIRAERLPIWTILGVLAGIWAFAYLIDIAGLAVSLLCLLVLSCAGRLLRNPVEVACTYVALLGLTWFVFVHVIQLPLKVFWWA